MTGPISVLVIAPKKSRFVTYVGAFEADPIGAWLDGVVKGATKTYPFSKMPEFVDVPAKASNVTPQPPPTATAGTKPKEEL